MLRWLAVLSIFSFLNLARASENDQRQVGDLLNWINRANKSDHFCSLAELAAKTSLQTKLADLDTSCLKTQLLVGPTVKDFPSHLPTINLTDAEQAALPANAKKIRALEIYLFKKYHGALNGEAIGWHGRASQQRIVWQDAKALELLSDRAMLRSLIYLSENDLTADYGGGNSLSSIVLFGISDNSPSYLVSATPNWPVAPKVKGVRWKALDDMRAASLSPETPRRVLNQDIEAASAVCRQILDVYSSSAEENPKSLDDAKSLNDRIDAMSSKELWTSVKDQIVKLDQEGISKLVGGQAGKSTEYQRMNGQNLEVMTEWKNLVKAQGGNVATTLGYGLISHALDMRHMMAAIYAIDHGPHTYRKVKSPEASRTLQNLLQQYADGKLDAESSALIRARLKQIYLNL